VLRAALPLTYLSLLVEAVVVAQLVLVVAAVVEEVAVSLTHHRP
jgi:hypothetical protein